MHVASLGLGSRIRRAAIPAAVLTTLFAVQPKSARLVEAAWATVGAAAARGTAVRELLLSDQARRYLALQYRTYPTEFMGCMIGEVHGSSVVVRRIAPADVEPAHSTATYVVPERSCEDAGWTGTVGMIHNHPGGERCWYYFPGTQVPTSDAQSFIRQRYAVDAIMCGDYVVWLSRDLVEANLSLVSAGHQTVAAVSER